MELVEGRSLPRTCVVIPCFNEANRLDVAAFDSYLASTRDVALVLVNDGSTDRTPVILGELAKKHPDRVRAMDLSTNQGKAEAVRQGMLLVMNGGEFDYAGFWDADLATPLDAIEDFVRVLERLGRVDVVFGARIALLGRRIDRKLSRHYLGRVFATAASLVLSLPVYDTQCGAKLFRVNERCQKLFANPFGSRWIFDVEIVARYCLEHSGQEGIFEQPVDQWRDIGESKVRRIDFVRAIGEMMIIYRTYSRRSNRSRLLGFVAAPFVRYAGAGAIGTLFHYATLSIAVEVFKTTPVTGSIVGAVVGALVNYILNYHLTFASQQSHKVTLPKFLTVAAFGVALNGLVVKVATTRLGVHYLVAQLFATVLVLGSGFVLNKLWTFARRA